MQTHVLPAPRLRPFRFLPLRRQSVRRGPFRLLPLAASPAQPARWRRARLVALAVGGFLLPWSALLAVTLPATAQAQNWALAWTGLDVAEAAAALVTAALLSRGDRRACLPAAAAGTLLLIDAWFDVCTSAPGAGHAMALAEAGCVEVPLAAAAWWIAIVLSGETR